MPNELALARLRVAAAAWALLASAACDRTPAATVPTDPFVPPAGASSAGSPGSFLRHVTGFEGVSRPALDSAAVYVVSRDLVVRAFDRQTGAARWAAPLPTPGGPRAMPSSNRASSS